MTPVDPVNGDARKTLLVLCSSSPRRRAILHDLGVAFVVRVPAGVVEATRGRPRWLVLANAERKARAVWEARRGGLGAVNKIHVGVDTLVVLRNQVLPKPSSISQAEEMIAKLGGRTHRVYSGVHVIGSEGREAGSVAVTAVRFRRLSAREARWYARTGEGMDKAGGYAIQGLGSLLVERIEGCYFNVVGFPLVAFREVLGRLGVDLLDLTRGECP